MFPKECEQCGGRFMAKRATAKFCSSRCRQRHHVAKDAPVLPPHREGAAVVNLPAPAAGTGESLAAATREELNAINRLRTPAGLLALRLAQILDSDIQDTGSSISALGKQYLATMKEAKEGVQQSQSPLDEIREALKLA